MSHRLCFVLWGVQVGGVERQAQLLAEAAAGLGHTVDLLVLGTDGPALAWVRPWCNRVQILNAPIHRDGALHARIRNALKGQAYAGAILFGTAKLTLVSNALAPHAPRQAVYVGNPVSPGAWTVAKHKLRALRFPPAEHLKLIACSQHTLRSLGSNPFFRHLSSTCAFNCVVVPDAAVAPRPSCDPLHIGMVARLDGIKDHPTLVGAVADLRRAGTDVRCHLIGDGSEKRRLSRLAEASGVSAAIVWEGEVQDVWEKLALLDVFVFATTASEGFGNAAAEAMALGLPCIFSDIGPCREVGGDAVLYVPPEDPVSLARAIRNLAPDLDNRIALGKAARVRAGALFRKEEILPVYLEGMGLANAAEVPEDPEYRQGRD